MMRDNRCKHYSGDVCLGGRCAAGVEVRKHVGGSDLDWLIRTPCFVEHAVKAFTCEHFALPTAEELEAERQESQRSIERIGKARAAIIGSGAKPRSAGSLECPVCGAGTLQWSMASNGHVHARCSTAGCVIWME
jgi:hypothetical protein